MRVFPQTGAPSEARPESLAELRAVVSGADNVLRGTVDRALADAVPLIEGLMAQATKGSAHYEMARLWLDNYRGFVTGEVHADG